MFRKFSIKHKILMVFDHVLGRGEHGEGAVGSPRAPASLPEWSRNDLEKNIFLESRSVNIFDFDVCWTVCVVFNSFGKFS